MYEAKHVLAIVVYCLSGNVLTVINKMLVMHFPFLFTILLIQCIGTVVFLKVGFRYFSHLIGTQPRYERDIFVKFSLLTFQFAMMLSTSMFALREVSVPTLIVMRNLATLITAVIESIFLKRSVLLREGICILVMLLGAISYAHNDILFTASGYKFLMLNVMFSSTYQVYVKKLVYWTKLSPWAMSYYNNCISMIIFALLFCVLEYPDFSQAVAPSLSTSCTLLISSFIGFSVSVTGFLLNHMVSPTAIMVINNVNKFCLIIANEFIIGKSQNMQTILSSIVVITSGFCYSLVRKKNTGMNSEKFSLKSRKVFKSASSICLILILLTICDKGFYLFREPANLKSSENAHMQTFTVPKLKLYGILEVKDDGNITKEWFQRHLRMFDGLVVFDGSSNDDVKIYVDELPNVIYTHENEHKRKYYTDSEHRGIATSILNSNWGTNNWVMVCHSDSFYYHDPRSMALLAEKDGADHISWFALHVLPHPTEYQTFLEYPMLEVHIKFRHFHWYGPSKGGTFTEHRMFKNADHLDFGVEWCSGPPLGVKHLWYKHPAYLHYKIPNPSLSSYDKNGRHKSHFKDVQLSKKDPFYKNLVKKTKNAEMPGVGVSWQINQVKDFFVDKYVGKPKYSVCTRFNGTLPQELDQFSPKFKAKPEILD